MKNEQQPKEKKNWLTVTNLITGLLLALLIALWVFPDLKALMRELLIKNLERQNTVLSKIKSEL